MMTKIKFETPFVFHCRNNKRKPFEKGGLTIVFDPTVRRFGIAECSKKDNYNRKVGKNIALGRARFSENHFPKNICQELDESSLYVETVKEVALAVAKHYGYSF